MNKFVQISACLGVAVAAGIAILFLNSVTLVAVFLLLSFLIFSFINPEAAFLVFLFSIPFGRPLSLFAVEDRFLYVNLPDILFICCALAYLARRVIDRDSAETIQLRQEPLVRWLLALALCCFGSWAINSVISPEHTAVALFSMLRYFRFPLFFLLAIKIGSRSIKRYYWILLLGGACSVLVGVIQILLPDTFSLLFAAPDNYGWGERVYGSFYSSGPNLYADYIAVLFCFAAGFFLFQKKLASRVWILALVGASLICFAQTLSRSGLAVLLVCLGSLWLVLREFRGRVALIAASLLILGVSYQPSEFRARMDNLLYGVSGPAGVQGMDYSTWRRSELAQLGSEELLSHPLLGRGFRPIGYVIANEGFSENGLHNAFLDIGVKAGIPALLCFLAFLFVSLRDIWRAAHSSSDPLRKAFLCSLWAALIGLTAGGLGAENFTDDNLAPLIWCLLGAAIYAVRLEQQEALPQVVSALLQNAET